MKRINHFRKTYKLVKIYFNFKIGLNSCSLIERMSAMESVQRLFEENLILQLDNLKLKQTIAINELRIKELEIIQDELKLDLNNEKKENEIKIKNLESGLERKEEELSNYMIVIRTLKSELSEIEGAFKPTVNNKRKQSNLNLSPSKRHKASHSKKGVCQSFKNFFLNA